MDLQKLYQTQISMTEWFKRIGHPDVEVMRAEDAVKRDRLGRLNALIGLPFDRPTVFAARAIADRSPELSAFVDIHLNEQCALRLIPLEEGLPLLRTRGGTVANGLDWFVQQGVDADKYRAEFIPHTDNQRWVTIFVVNEKGVFGQVAHGRHSQLTQGFFEDDNVPSIFSWDYSGWNIEPALPGAQEHLEELMTLLRVEDPAMQQTLAEEFGSTFGKNHLCGYFETTTSDEFGVWFVDYNRLLGKKYGEVSPSIVPTGELRGQIGSPGLAQGRARVIRSTEVEGADIEPGDILVTDMTSPAFVPLMLKAGAVVTAWGGILSHAAIVCREIGKPCLTNVKGALEQITDGAHIAVDATTGVVTLDAV